jgi:hypothetical protein
VKPQHRRSGDGQVIGASSGARSGGGGQLHLTGPQRVRTACHGAVWWGPRRQGGAEAAQASALKGKRHAGEGRHAQQAAAATACSHQLPYRLRGNASDSSAWAAPQQASQGGPASGTRTGAGPCSEGTEGPAQLASSPAATIPRGEYIACAARAWRPRNQQRAR